MQGRGLQGAKSPLLWEDTQVQEYLAGSPLIGEIKERLKVCITFRVRAHASASSRGRTFAAERGLSTQIFRGHDADGSPHAIADMMQRAS